MLRRGGETERVKDRPRALVFFVLRLRSGVGERDTDRGRDRDRERDGVRDGVREREREYEAERERERES